MLNRRSLLRGLLSTPAVVVIPRVPAAEAGRSLLIQESKVAGTQFYAWSQIRHSLQSGDVLILRRNPYNAYDRRAVEIWRGEDMLGHLPTEENVAVSQMMDRGERLVAELSRVVDAVNPWRRLRVCVRLVV